MKQKLHRYLIIDWFKRKKVLVMPLRDCGYTADKLQEGRIFRWLLSESEAIQVIPIREAGRIYRRSFSGREYI